MSQPGGGPPYGDPPTSSPGGNPYALPPNSGSPGYPYGSGGLFPPPDPPKKGLSGGAITGIVIGAVVLLLVIAGGVVGVIYWVNSGNGGQPAAGGSPAPSGSSNPSSSASPSGAPDGIANIQVGQCLRQIRGLAGGRDTAVPAACTEPNTLRVVARFDATTDKTRCKGSGQAYDVTFTHTDPTPTESYVLCLKNQA